MELDDVKIGLKVEITKLEDNTRGMFVAKKHLDVRRVGAKGTVVGYVPGHGGDVWWVRHDDETVGVYIFDEFELLK